MFNQHRSFDLFWHHDHDHGSEEKIEENTLWLMDNIELKSVGIDIGSSGTQVIFSRLKMERKGEDLTSRYVIVSREAIYHSPVYLTPYISDNKIDNDALEKIIEQEYQSAGFHSDEIDTGAVILTGEAIRRENAQSIGHLFAEKGGNFVCATAGHNMEALLAAFGSGAAYQSYDKKQRILNIDIGGGTTKLAVVENGKVLDTAALYVGGRLFVIDENRRITRLDPGGKSIAEQNGYTLEVGDVLSQETLDQLTKWMAQAIVTAVSEGTLPKEIENLYLTPPLKENHHIDGIMFSGGVGEYVYEREERDFGDLGKSLGHALKEQIVNKGFLWPLLPAGECIRATVVGASEYSVQVSGNTIFISDQDALPKRNLQVLHPKCDLNGDINEGQVSKAIQESFKKFDLVEGDADVALSFSWGGDPSYERISALVEGLVQGLETTILKKKPIVLVFDGDIAKTVGTLLTKEKMLENSILSIDGVFLQEFDFIDIGKKLYPSGTVPVTIKSLLFQL